MRRRWENAAQPAAQGMGLSQRTSETGRERARALSVVAVAVAWAVAVGVDLLFDAGVVATL